MLSRSSPTCAKQAAWGSAHGARFASKLVVVRDRYRLIADAAVVVADPVVRQMGTVVGSLCHNDPAGDWPVVALAARAEVLVRGKAAREPLRSTTLSSTRSRPPSVSARWRSRCASQRRQPHGRLVSKIERKVGDFATASAAVQITLAPDGTIADAGIAIGAVGPMALRVKAAEKLLSGAKPTKEVVAQPMREARTSPIRIPTIADRSNTREPWRASWSAAHSRQRSNASA